MDISVPLGLVLGMSSTTASAARRSAEELHALRLELAAARGVRLPTIEEEALERREQARQDWERAQAWAASPEGQQAWNSFVGKILFCSVLLIIMVLGGHFLPILFP